MAKLHTLFRTMRSKTIPCPAAHPSVHPPGLKRFKKHQLPYFEMPWQINTIANRSFSHDVMAAIFIYKKMNRRPCLCTIPVGIELFSHVKTFFCSKQIICKAADHATENDLYYNEMAHFNFKSMN